MGLNNRHLEPARIAECHWQTVYQTLQQYHHRAALSPSSHQMDHCNRQEFVATTSVRGKNV